jgi:hypothetical protein
MPKALLIATIVVAIVSGFGPATAAQAAGRSFEECQKIALARGLRYATPPKRYTMLKGHGHKTNPQGMMARCMAGL